MASSCGTCSKRGGRGTTSSFASNCTINSRYAGSSCATVDATGGPRGNIARPNIFDPVCHGPGCASKTMCQQSVYTGLRGTDGYNGDGGSLSVTVDGALMKTTGGDGQVQDPNKTCASFFSFGVEDFDEGPYVISAPGIYTINTNSLPPLELPVPSDGLIIVASSNVEIRLGTVVLRPTALYASLNPDLAGIRIRPGFSNVFIRGGTIRQIPYGIATDDQSCLSTIGLNIYQFSRAAVILAGVTSGEIVDSQFISNYNSGSYYEIAQRLLAYLSGSPYEPQTIRAINDDDRTTIIANLQAEVDAGYGDMDLGFSEAGLVGIIHGPSEIPPAKSLARGLLVSRSTISVEAAPREVIGIAIAGKLLRDPMGYLIPWTEVIATPLPVSTNVTVPVTGGTGLATPTNPALLAAQLWASLNAATGSTLTDSFVNWYNGGGVGTLSAKPVAGLDFRGQPLVGVAGVAQMARKPMTAMNAENNQYSRVQIQAINNAGQSPNERLSYRKNQRYRAADAYGALFDKTQTTTIDGSDIGPITTIWGRAHGAYFDDKSRNNAVVSTKIHDVTAGPSPSTPQTYGIVNTQPHAYGVYSSGSAGYNTVVNVTATGYSTIGEFIPFVSLTTGPSNIVTGPTSAGAPPSFTGFYPAAYGSTPVSGSGGNVWN